MTSRPGHSIAIVPVGSFDLELIEFISEQIKQVFGFSCEILPLLNDLAFAFDSNRKQYHSTKILERLADKIPPHVAKALAIVQVDLFIPILTHVYGEAQLGGKVCAVSTFRLNEGHPHLNIREPYLSRIMKEAIHELGHTFTLRHCKDHNCLMHYCRNETDVDRKTEELCRYCKILLEDELKKSGM
ncbi:MAG: archaemetzincin family Zn-dependent metalloprotease [Desulfobacterales bacterium]|nr:MAG: archaemetzincin family Zn-dependent metalloprotease [Desulfobacterales bacterium]